VIRDYVNGDLKRIKGNCLLRERSVYVREFEKRENYTIEIDGKIVMIFSYKAYAPGRYTVYMEGSKYLNLGAMKEAKRHWITGIKSIKPIRIETTSIANKTNDRFHRFFGFELEGTKKNYLDGEDYNVWGWI